MTVCRWLFVMDVRVLLIGLQMRTASIAHAEVVVDVMFQTCWNDS